MIVKAADFMDDICRPKSRDAKFCVSRGGICCYCQRFIEWVYWYGLDVRRKILCLYWADAVGLMCGVVRMVGSGCGVMCRGRKVKNLDIVFS